MIGQSQVTDPLMTALRTNRVNHAYLFSGPRGCGKTTSARILARCLNCAEGPTDTPCGVCPSCVELSRDGGGSLDVVEIDAASHGGVDDARDLRERAIFAPARDRYKIFIMDEAHMVTSSGFNALLKIVEEPPEHVKFIFATTEPEKVIGTIRSRTHHYPFRLVPPGPMLEYVQTLCDAEGVTVAPGVLPLVVRAGGGSPRDTLSLLDQLMAGSESSSVDYERAVALLGYTHGALLDEVIDAIGAREAGAAFEAVDRVIQTGQDPRRFVEDLLERMRDLIVVGASTPAVAASVLRGVPQDELAAMGAQATRYGQAELSRTADIVNAALTEMTGATSPRLHLELMIARALVPSSDDSERGALARVERLERRVGVTDAASDRPAAPAVAASSAPAPASAPVSAPAPAAAPAPMSPAVAAAAEFIGRLTPPAAAATPPRADGPVGPVTWATPGVTGTPEPEPAAVVAPAAPAQGAPAKGAPTKSSPAQGAPAKGAPAQGAPAQGAPAKAAPAPVKSAVPVGPISLQQMRDAWPQVLEVVKTANMNAWVVLLTAVVREYREDGTLLLAFPSENDVAALKKPAAPGQGVGDHLKKAVATVLGVTPKLLARAEGGEQRGSKPTPAAAPAQKPAPDAADAEPDRSASAPSSAPSAAQAAAPAPAPAAAAPAPTARVQPKAAAKSAPVTTSNGWSVVQIPQSEPAPAAEPEVAPVAVQAPPSAPPVAAPTRPAGPPPVAAPAPAADGWAAAEEPPFGDEPPYDDEPPFDPNFDAAPPDQGFRSGPSAPAAPAAPPAAPAPAAQAERPQPRQAPQRPAQAPGRGDGVQRYGESVVREILGATFIEEQPHNPGSRATLRDGQG
ncbi:DNA polymerase III subunit gamma and tau [Microterricola viridarii]|nr:DNA polymerase III subunit gamma and tau [Microterricola viridarii]